MRVLWVTLLVVLADQITKVWIKLTLGAADTFDRSVPVVGELFKLTYTENPGMAFGLSLGSKLFLTVFSIVATVLIAFYLWHVRRGPTGYRVALALILGGAVGNIIDRVFYGAIWGECYGAGHRLLYGCVVDFIHIDLWRGVVAESVPFFGGRYLAVFPIGNLADLTIIAGVAAIIIFQRRFHNQLEAQKAAEAPPAVPEEGATDGVGATPVVPAADEASDPAV